MVVVDWWWFSYSVGVSMSRALWRLVVLWNSSMESWMAVASSILVFHVLRLSNSTCMRPMLTRHAQPSLGRRVTFAPRPIDDVLAQLLEEDDDQFVYRGQSRDYGIVLPSGMRGAVRSVTGAACQLDRRVLVAQCTVRAQQQILFRQGLISTLGAGIGHVFAQQYGFGSDVIDVSSSPRIAAFFATRLWPTCSHIADAPGPGVIYRWRKPEEERTSTELRADTPS